MSKEQPLWCAMDGAGQPVIFVFADTLEEADAEVHENLTESEDEAGLLAWYGGDCKIVRCVDVDSAQGGVN